MKIETVKCESLQEDDRNARKHNHKNIKTIAASLEQFGQRKPIVVWQNTVIAGNGTLQAANLLGWDTIEITRVPSDWTVEQARAYALADNRSAELADWDQSVLDDLLTELDGAGWDRMDLGFNPVEPVVDPYSEWEGMPEYENENLNPAARVIIQFLTLEDAEAFFKMIDRPKASSMWWPQGDLEQMTFTKSHVYVNES